MNLLTDREQKVLDLLVEAWNEYQNLLILHPDHVEDFRHAIHEAQRLIMVRPFLREIKIDEILEKFK